MSETEAPSGPKNGTRASRPNKEYKRSYMACLPCRKTKAKCEISDDSASCVKCRRERRDCVFSSERSTKRRKTGESVTVGENLVQSNAQSVRETDVANSCSTKLFPTDYTYGRSKPLSHASSLSDNNGQQDGARPEQDESLPIMGESSRLQLHKRPSASNLDATVMHTVVSSSKDALGLLFKAAEQQDSDDPDEQVQPSNRVFDSPGSALTSGFMPPSLPISALSNPEQYILDLWGHSRFVRQGWFSAREAVTYIDLYFQNLSNLSPMSDTFYSDHVNHRKLILEEPFLCCTLIMISSRYHVLPGVGGSSRALFVHSRMYSHVQHLIQRITFGQEKYSTAKTRTLGSVLALLIMTEWHPRALHFPPEGDGWDSSLAPSIDDAYGNPPKEDANMNRWREEVFEPAKRSDRMSWMILGLATTLAHELGVFDSAEIDGGGLNGIKKWRMGRLLFLNVNLLALRLGCTSLIPQNTIQSTTYPAAHLASGYEVALREQDALITMWIDLTKLLTTARELFFSSRASTKQILQSGRYIPLLEHFQPLLTQWLDKFSNFHSKTLAEVSLQSILIDFHYVKMYINSLAIQALVERTTNRGHSETNFDYDIMRLEHGQDYKFIQEVIEASREILSKAVLLAEAGSLRYSPVRIFLRITSASIFLLKAISLGVRNSELQKSLNTLDRCIQALRYSTLDDVHLSSRYSILIERHVRRFRRNFRVQTGLNTIPTGPSSPRQSSSQLPDGGQLSTTQPASQPLQNGDAENLDSFYGNFDANMPMDDWLVQPFDPSIAPFGLGVNQSASGLELDSLDFLWTLAG